MSSRGELPQQEARMLAVLREAGGGVVSRQALVEAIYAGADDLPASAFCMPDAVASRLRRASYTVVAVRGRGYRLVTE